MWRCFRKTKKDFKLKIISKQAIIDYYEKQTSLNTDLRILPDAIGIIYDLILSTELSYVSRKNVYFAFGYLLHEDDDLPEKSLDTNGLLDDLIICLYVINEISLKYGKEVILDISNVNEVKLDELILKFDELIKSKNYLRNIVKKYF